MQKTRQFDSNLSYIEGRDVELFIDKWFQKNGYITKQTRGSKNSFDLQVAKFQTKRGIPIEFIIQIKSSKKRQPYITCKHLEWLLNDAIKMQAVPLVCFCYTLYKVFVIFHPLTKKVYFTNAQNAKELIALFKCANKQK